MKGRIVNYRRSRHVQTNNHMVIKIEGVAKRDDAAKLAGKNVTWKSPAGKELKGTMSAAHGNSGAVRARFETGMPGQAVGAEVEIS